MMTDEQIRAHVQERRQETSDRVADVAWWVKGYIAGAGGADLGPEHIAALGELRIEWNDTTYLRENTNP